MVVAVVIVVVKVIVNVVVVVVWERDLKRGLVWERLVLIDRG